MKFISNNNINDPSLNLAMEEYVLKNLPSEESYFLFYINRPSIIVGKNQNTIEEVNQAYIDKHQIDVVRRISGGGAVYHDTGNLNLALSQMMMAIAFIILKSLRCPLYRPYNQWELMLK